MHCAIQAKTIPCYKVHAQSLYLYLVLLCPGTGQGPEGFYDPTNTPNPLATTREKYLWGLFKGKDYARGNIIVKEVQGRGRSAFAAKYFRGGDFVCDYGGVVREKLAQDWGDERNASLHLGCYCLDAVYNKVTYVFDATASINDPGRYINHASQNCNLTLMPPVMVGEPPNGHLQIGFVATSDIKAGEELFYNYGIKDPELPWLTTNAKKIATTVQALTSPQPQVQSAPSSKKSKPRPRPAPKRVARQCPIPGCKNIRPLLKLADHIRVMHPECDETERHQWLQKAKVTPISVSVFTCK